MCDLFCRSWKRGRNENADGLLRQYFPKNMESLDITANAVEKLNSRQRKCLEFKTRYEVFEKLTGVDVRKITVGNLATITINNIRNLYFSS